jgi:hypothetical protein
VVVRKIVEVENKQVEEERKMVEEERMIAAVGCTIE